MQILRTALRFAIVAATACVCSAWAQAGSEPSIGIAKLIPRIEDFRGRSVRACGSELQQEPGSRRWDLLVPRVVGYHPARLRVIPCAAETPRLDGSGCLAGRIAREDGSTDPIPPDRERIVSSEIYDHDWFLHASCHHGQRGN
jgi:hypothetical protein